jgi:uncharacterized protein YfbU (UPF0304 family)
MPTITLRVDDRAKSDLDALARSRDTTITDLLRPLVDELTGRATQRPGDHPVHLSLVERRILSLQHEILGKLDPDLEEHHRLRSQALDAGYAVEYAQEFAGVDHGLTARDCELVQDILDMFLILRASTDRLDAVGIASLGNHAEALLAFCGFDLNDPLEGRMLGYARFLLETDRWTDLAEYFDDKHERGNSHGRTLPTYRRMLEAYEPLFNAKTEDRGHGPDQYLFSADELAAVARAAIHPDNRRG